MSALGDNVRSKRLTAGLTQEELAHAANVAPSTVAKLEQGGSVRIETLHKLARALQLRTSELMTSGTPIPPSGEVSSANVSLVALRTTLTPPVGLVDTPGDQSEVPDLRALRAVTRRAAEAYAALNLDPVAKRLPDLVRDTNSAVVYYDNGPEHDESREVRAEALLLAGRYLTSVRQYDLAYRALSNSIYDARKIDNVHLAAQSIGIMSWLMTRQGRFDDAEAVALDTAGLIEPRISEATPARLCAWGWLALHGASAAIRNNRPDAAKNARRVAASAASALGDQTRNLGPTYGRFDNAVVAMKGLEDELISDEGNPYRVIEESTGKALLSDRSLEKAGVAKTDIEWNRHRLTVAAAYIQVGSHDEAMERLKAIAAVTPGWLRYQQTAKDALREIVRSRKRKITGDMRRMVALLDVAA